MDTSLEFQKTRKSDYQLFPMQTSEDILGINASLRQSPLSWGGELRNHGRDHILAFYISPPWSGGYGEAVCCLQGVEIHIKKSLHIISLHSTWTLVATHKGTQDSS